MFCKNCGKEIDDNAIICIHCGVSTNLNRSGAAMYEDGELGCLLGGLCFIAPVAGLILYLVWKDTMPHKAKQAGKWALIGFVANILFSIIYFVGMLGASDLFSYY